MPQAALTAEREAGGLLYLGKGHRIFDLCRISHSFEGKKQNAPFNER